MLLNPSGSINSAKVSSSPLTASPSEKAGLATTTGAGNIGDRPQPMPDIASLSTEGSEEAQSGSPDGIRSPRDQIIELCMGDYAKTPQGPLSQECKNAIESLTDFKNVNFHEFIKHDKKRFNLFHLISLEKLPEVFELILKRANEAGIKDAFMHLTEALSTGNPSYFSEYRCIYPREREQFIQIEQFIQNEITVTGYSGVMSPYSFAQKRDIQIITRGLNAVIGSLKESDSAFDKAAVELRSWAEELDVKPNEKRFDALERILIHLAKKRSHGLKLDLSGLGLTSFPNMLGKYKNIAHLNLQKNALTNIPFGLPSSSLTTLNLSDNRITQIDTELKNLTKDCHVFLLGNPLSADTINLLKEQCNAPGYNGPKIYF